MECCVRRFICSCQKQTSAANMMVHAHQYTVTDVKGLVVVDTVVLLSPTSDLHGLHLLHGAVTPLSGQGHTTLPGPEVGEVLRS